MSTVRLETEVLVVGGGAAGLAVLAADVHLQADVQRRQPGGTRRFRPPRRRPRRKAERRPRLQASHGRRR